jgi:hypothetical protein
MRFGDAADQIAGVSVDGSGNILLGCRFQGALTFADNIKLNTTVAGAWDGCVVKLDPDGAPLWGRAFGATDTHSVLGKTGGGPVADAQGNVFVSTNFQGTADLGGGPLTSGMGGYDFAIARFSPSGQHAWSKVFGGQGQQQLIPLVSSPDGYLFAAGTFEGALDSAMSAGSYDAWAGRLDPDGNLGWVRAYGDAAIQGIYNAAATPDGGVVLVGGFEGTMSFTGGDSLVSTGGFDAFVAKLDAGGNHQWSRSFGDANSIVQMMVTAAPNGDILVLLGTDQVVDFGGGPLDTVAGIDLVVARLDGNGSHLWSKRFGAQEEQFGLGVQVDSRGCIVVASEVKGSIDFGGGPLVSAGDSDVVVAKLDPDGNHVWSQRFGSAGLQQVTTMAVDGNDDILLAGGFEGTLDFGGTPLQSAGGQDIFIAKLGR